jgi:hypothetical protein
MGMHKLIVRLNGKELLSTDSIGVAWLSWDVVACCLEPQYASLSVGGAIEVTEGRYDVLDWLTSFPIDAGCTLEFEVSAGRGISIPHSRRTPTEQEALRQTCLVAEASGELDAVQIGPRKTYRHSCSLALLTQARSPITVRTIDSIDAVTSGGMWSAGHKPDQWRLRAATIPGKDVTGGRSTSFWCPIENAARIQLGM